MYDLFPLLCAQIRAALDNSNASNVLLQAELDSKSEELDSCKEENRKAKETLKDSLESCKQELKAQAAKGNDLPYSEMFDDYKK